MSEPAVPPPIAHDPLTSILIMLTELRKDVQTALANQEKHGATLTTHGEKIDSLDSRVTVLETVRSSDDRHEDRRFNGKVLAWTVVGALAMVVSALVAILVMKG